MCAAMAEADEMCRQGGYLLAQTYLEHVYGELPELMKPSILRLFDNASHGEVEEAMKNFDFQLNFSSSLGFDEFDRAVTLILHQVSVSHAWPPEVVEKLFILDAKGFLMDFMDHAKQASYFCEFQDLPKRLQGRASTLGVSEECTRVLANLKAAQQFG